jgi:hypothetical protein
MTEEEEVSLILNFLKIQQLMQQIDDAKNLKEDLINENSSKFEELNRMRVSFFLTKDQIQRTKNINEEHCFASSRLRRRNW